MDIFEANDANLEVNANLTYDSVSDNSVEMDCDTTSKNVESSISNKDEVDVSDGSELNSSLIAI